jgi:uncharacterized protein YlxP (DUF503 family)
MTVAILTMHLELPGCASLKDKRSRIKPILARLHREFNVSSAELDLQDHWQESVLACAMLGGDAAFLQRALQEVLDFTARMWPDTPILAHHIEVF